MSKQAVDEGVSPRDPVEPIVSTVNSVDGNTHLPIQLTQHSQTSRQMSRAASAAKVLSGDGNGDEIHDQVDWYWVQVTCLLASISTFAGLL